MFFGEVYFTRLSDKYVPLSDRVKFANNCVADYFLSIHINSTSNSSVRGTEVWMYSNDDKKFNNFCDSLCSDVSEVFKVRNRGIKYSKSLYVLKNTFMKAALLEVDFISNESCEKDLNNDEYIKAVASSIKDNILRLYGIEDSKGILYKVCIGSYKDRANAINLAKSKSFSDAYIM